NGHVYLSVRESDLTKPESSLPEPFMADIINRRVRSSEEILRRVRRPSPAKTHPLDDFDIIPSTLEGPPKHGDDPPVKLLFTPTGLPVEVTWPKWSMHKMVDGPEDGPHHRRLSKAETVTTALHPRQGNADASHTPLPSPDVRHQWMAVGR